MSGMDFGFEKMAWGAAGIGSVFYSVGTGQVLGIPGSLVSAVTAAVFGLIELANHHKMKHASQADDIEFFRDRKFQAKHNALYSCAAAAFFALGIIPVIGGPLGVYCAYKIHRHVQLESNLRYVQLSIDINDYLT